MRGNYTDQTTFEKRDFTTDPLPGGEYEACIFINCNLSDINLGNMRFTDCSFTDCNIGNAKLSKTTLNNVTFTGCKLLGLHFGDCDSFLFSATFNNCILNYSSFYKLMLKKTVFRNCQVHEADFTEADLSGAVFDHCDLSKTIFERTTLEKTDFRSAYNYSINPEINRMKKARFSIQGITGLLHKYDIEVT